MIFVGVLQYVIMPPTFENLSSNLDHTLASTSARIYVHVESAFVFDVHTHIG